MERTSSSTPLVHGATAGPTGAPVVLPRWLDAEVASDAAGEAVAMRVDIAPLGPDQSVVGPAVTALTWRDDNAVIQDLLQGERHDDCVLVVAGAATSTCSVIGDVTARRLRQAGFIGLVTDGPVRDAAELRAIGFPVWCRGVAIAASGKRRPGYIGLPVSIGGVVVSPGDIVVGSSSGVAVWPSEAVPDLLTAALVKHEDDEARIRQVGEGARSSRPVEVPR